MRAEATPKRETDSMGPEIRWSSDTYGAVSIIRSRFGSFAHMHVCLS